jgi:hypothetical protein
LLLSDFQIENLRQQVTSLFSNLQSKICNLKCFLRSLFLRRFFRGYGCGSGGFLRNRPLRGFSPFPLLITAVMRLLIGRLFLHVPIISQIHPNSTLTHRRSMRL